MDCDFDGWSSKAVSDALGIHPDTGRRWKRQGRVPSHRAAAIKLALQGDLGSIDDTWHGFVLRQGRIWTPENQPVMPGELRAIPYRRELIDELRRQLQQPQQWSLQLNCPEA